MASKKKPSGDLIAVNRRARFDYVLEAEYEAGLVLEGWEVGSLRRGRGQLTESHVTVRRGEAYLVGAHFAPLAWTSTHRPARPVRDRKLLLHRREIARLAGAVERQGYALVPLRLYWRNRRVKLAFALARGKKQYDKRQSLKQQQWNRDRLRLLKRS